MRDAATTRRARRGGAAPITVGLLMAALGLALAGCQSAKSGAGGVTIYPTIPVPTATATPPPTATPIGGPWTVVTNLSQVASIAPAALRTQYGVFSGQDSKSSPPYFKFQRSDDFGQTWRNLAPPQISGVVYPDNISVAIGTESPLNPNVYILTLQLQNAPCSPSGGMALAGSYCQVQYVTANGGASWRKLALPAAGLLGAFAPTMSPREAMTPQGTRLYSFVSQVALASSGSFPPGRLIASDDGGVTWNFADGTLSANGLMVFGYAVAPTGSTVYALAGVNDPNLMPGQLPPLALWRSDDGGADWAKAGALPGQYVDGLMVGAANGQMTAYLLAANDPKTQHLYASHDGGAHWSDSGVQTTAVNELLTTLPNGSVLFDANSNIYEWDGGAQAPRAVASSPGALGPQQVWVQTQADGSTRLWMYGQGSNGPVYQYITLIR